MTNSTTTSATSATGALIHILATTLLLLIYPISSWCSEDSKPPQIEREIINKSLPTAEIAHQRIFVSFEGSPKMTRILQEKLRAKGFTVVDDSSAADARFEKWINGTTERKATSAEIEAANTAPAPVKTFANSGFAGSA